MNKGLQLENAITAWLIAANPQLHIPAYAEVIASLAHRILELDKPPVVSVGGGWISEETKLPEPNLDQPLISEDVLVCEDGFYPISVCYYHFGRKRWCKSDLSSTRDMGEVTHWQPLPEPPNTH